MAVTRRSGNTGTNAVLTNTVTCTKPAGTASGDMLLAWVGWSVYPVQTAPTGWALARSISNAVNGVSNGLDLWFKVAGGAEPANYSWTFTGSWMGQAVSMTAYYGQHTNYLYAFDMPLDSSTPYAGVATSVTGSNYYIDLASGTTRQNDDLVVAGVWGVHFGDQNTDTITTMGSSWANLQQIYVKYNLFGDISGVIGTADYTQGTAGATLSGAAVTNGTVDSGKCFSITAAIRPANRTPNLPSLLFPKYNIGYNINGASTFRWTFSDPDIGDTQLSYALKRNGGSDQWWNAGTSAWQGTEVYNTSSNQYLTFVAGKWTGAAYYWYVSVKDQDGLISGYSSVGVVTQDTPPTVALLTPSNPLGESTTPLVSWSYSGGTGVQSKMQLKVFTDATVTATDFNPETDPTVYDSGEINSESKNTQITTPLTAGDTYWAYLRVADTSSPVCYTDWITKTFTVTLLTPNTPSIATTMETSPSVRTKIDISAYENHMTFNQSTLDQNFGTSGWKALSNCSLSVSSVWSSVGQYSLLVTPTGAGDASLISLDTSTTAGLEGRDVITGKSYKALAVVRADTGATVRSCRLDIRWYDSAGTLLSTTTGTAATSSKTVNTQLTTTATAPASATFAAVVPVVISTAGAADKHYFDQIGLFPGAATAWSRGGVMYGNLLTFAQSSSEPDISGVCSVGTATVITRDETNSVIGDGSWKLTCSTAGDMAITQSLDGTTTTPIACTPNQSYTFIGSILRGSATAETSYISAYWYDANGNFISNDLSTTITTSAAWQKLALTSTAPSTAYFMNLVVTITDVGAAEFHYVDALAIQRGSSQLWSPPPASQAYIKTQYSDDSGTTWATVRGSQNAILDAEQKTTIYDYSVPINPAVSRQYRARVRSEV